MQLGELLAGLPDAQARGPTDIEISGIAYDSRAVRPGNLFVAIGGFHVDGHAYIPQALEHGAAAVVGEKATGELPLPPELPYVRISNARTALAPIAAAFYGHPGRQMRVVGITGTDGKTTTTFLTSAVLEAGGHTTGMIGTVDFKLAARQWANDTRQSTPEAPEVQAMLREMADAGCDYAVLESTSHALSARWNRLGGAQFDVAVLTNVTHEHLDFHGSVEQYRRDKVRLFEMLGERPLSVVSSQLQGATDNRQQTTDNDLKWRKVAIVNTDDPHHQLFLDAAPARAERLTYGVHHPADVRAHDVAASQHGLRFRVETPWGSAQLNLRLTGDFNVSNALAALTVGLAEGVPLDAAVLALEGSAGERGREKRAIQGQVAARYCDFVVLTDEDPRLEDREAIIAEIAAGAEQSGKREGSGYVRIPDRPTAIRAAFEHARPGDIVLLLGKGHEGCIIYGEQKVPWDEAGAARAALRALGYAGLRGDTRRF